MQLKQIRWILWCAATLAAVSVAAAIFWQQTAQRGVGTETGQAFRADFELTDHQGMIRRDEDFAGKWLLVFFGFTNCPDICPATLSEVATVMDGLGDGTERVQPIFVSIDPERDTPATLADFVSLFDAGIIGLTGTPDQIAATTRSFFVYSEKDEEEAAPDGYTMSHSSQLFLFDANTEFVKTYEYGTSAEVILTDLRGRIAR